MSTNAKLISKTQLLIAILLLSTAVLTSMTMLTGTMLASNTASADDGTSVVDEINITVPVSCTLSGTGMNTHNASINNGQYDSAIGETTMKAFCNDNNGFAIYAIGYTDNKEGKNVLTNSTLGSAYDITTGIAITGNDSRWAMKLTKLTSPAPTYPVIIAGSTEDSLKQQNDPNFTTFQEVPGDYTKVAYRTSATDTGANAEGAALATTYQAYISRTQPAGTYVGQVKYTLVHPYNAAKPIIPVSIATATYFQEVNSCPADIPEEQIYTIKDSRDEQEYKVAKLKDGKCWMVENLNLAGGTILYSDNTDYTSDYQLPNDEGWSLVFPGIIKLPDSSNQGFGFNRPKSAYVFNSGNKENCGDTVNQDTPCYSYYSWEVATLGSGRSVNHGDAPYSICPKGWKLPSAGGNTDNQWKTGDTYNLAVAYGLSLDDEEYATNNTLFYENAGPNTTPGFLLAGEYTSYGLGTGRGLYWSSTSASEQDAYSIFFNTSLFHSAQFTQRSFGHSIRCVFSSAQ